MQESLLRLMAYCAADNLYTAMCCCVAQNQHTLAQKDLPGHDAWMAPRVSVTAGGRAMLVRSMPALSVVWQSALTLADPA